MDILFYRYGSICEQDIADVFQQMGFTVREVLLELTNKQAAPAEKLGAVSAALEAHIPDFVFSINYFPFLSELCERIGLSYVCFSVDSPVPELFSRTLKNRCNRIFLFDYAQYQTFSVQNPDCIFYLPLATNTARWDSLLSPLTADAPPAYTDEISFVGSLYHEKSPLSLLKPSPLSEQDTGYMDGLIAAQLQVSGAVFLEDAVSEEWIARVKQCFPDFPKVADPFADPDRYIAANLFLGYRAAETERIRTLNALAEHFPVTLYTRSDTSLLRSVICRDGVATHTQMPRIFRNSKINLNITLKSIQTGIPLRIWDVLGCGGFLLSNYQAEIPEYLEPGRDLDCYENLSELHDKVQYYLTHDDVRQEIAYHGYRKAAEQHTWIHRIAAMLRQLSYFF